MFSSRPDGKHRFQGEPEVSLSVADLHAETRSRKSNPTRYRGVHLPRRPAVPVEDRSQPGELRGSAAGEDAVVVILTALDLEYQSVRRWLAEPRRVDHPAGTVFEVGRLPAGQGLAALAVTGQGNTAAAVMAERAITMFRPCALICVGVAGALNDDIALGDIVVATKVYAYHGGKAQPGGFRPRPRCWEIPHQLDQIARYVHRTGSWTARLSGDPTRPPPAVHFGPVAAGEVVLDGRSTPLFRHLRDSYGDAVAIDMESAGATHAGQLNGALPVLTVRGISDRADGAKHSADRDNWQPIAAANAAAFALAIVTEVVLSGFRQELISGLPARGGGS
jgi:nucleoside phosphorylase